MKIKLSTVDWAIAVSIVLFILVTCLIFTRCEITIEPNNIAAK